MSIMIQALQQKLRFDSSKGRCGTEDLFDLPMEDLDAMYMELMPQVEQVSYLKRTTLDPVNKLRVQVLAAVMDYRQEQAANKSEAAARKSHNEKIDRLIQQKQDEKLTQMSVEELEAMKQ